MNDPNIQKQGIDPNSATGTRDAVDPETGTVGTAGTPLTAGYGMSGSTIGAGSQMLQPLAIAVIGGVLISMVLSLIITPAVHFYLGGKDHAPEHSPAS